MRHFNIDGSGAQVAHSEAMRLGAHIHRDEGRDFAVNDATGFFLGIAYVGESRAACLTLVRDGRSDAIGLNVCLTIDDAQDMRAALADIIALLEADAAGIADAAIRKAGGRIPDQPIPQTAGVLSLDAYCRAGRAQPPSQGASGQHFVPFARLNARLGAAALAFGVWGALCILGRAAWAWLS